MKKSSKRNKRKVQGLFCSFILFIILGWMLLEESTVTWDGQTLSPVFSEDKRGEMSELEVHFIDVGQGDCTLIMCGEHAMLIDAGDNSKGTAVQLYLQKKGVETLDYVVGTHPDADHIGGLDVIISKFDCKTIFMPDHTNDTKTYRDVIDAISYRGYEVTLPEIGNTYTLGNANFTIIAPAGSDYAENTNNYSIGIRFIYGENSFLFVGDAEKEAERDILKINRDIRSDVLKISHHGSKTSTSQNFLDAVSPAYAIICCAENNDYGFPHAEVLNRLRKAGVKIFRTDEQGSIIAISDGKQITFNTAPSETWQTGDK